MERRCTLGEVIEEALQKSLTAKPAGGSRKPTRLTTFQGNGVQPGVDLDSSVGVLDVMEDR